MKSSRSGMTMLEIMVSTAVLSVVMISVALVTKSSNSVYRTTQARDVLRQRSHSALNRIVDTISTASKSTFGATLAAPFGSSTIDFRTPTGLAGGVVSWTAPSRIAYQASAQPQGQTSGHGAALDNDGEIVLIRDAGTAKAVTTVLVSHVAAYLEGETANGKDDNGNGLVDERGLSFVLTGDQLTVRLTVADYDPDGQPVWVTSETQIRLRN